AKALEYDSTLSIAHTATGDIHLRNGSHQRAADSYEEAIQHNPLAFKPHYNLGVTYQELSDQASMQEKVMSFLRKAADAYLGALAVREDDFDANLNISTVYFSLGDYQRAEKYCRRATEIDPNSAVAHTNLGTVCQSQDQFHEAIKAYNQALEIDMHQPQILLRLGETYLSQGPDAYRRAMRTFKKATQEAPEDPEPWERLGLVHYKLRELDKALEAYEKAVELAPERASAHRGVGTIHIAQYVLNGRDQQMRDLGLDAWVRSLELDPQQPQLRQLVQKYAPEDQMPSI
ncbi:MAG: tetratricopeptide repeat protein, partial [Planctomycetota bacterium]